MKALRLVLFLAVIFIGKLFGQTKYYYSPITTSYTLANNTVYSIAMNSKGDKWFGLKNAVSYVRGNTWASQEFYSGVPGYDFKMKAAVDSKGNAWIAKNSILGKYDNAGWHWDFYTISAVSSIAVDGIDNAWVGSYYGVYKFDGTNWTNYTTTNGLVNNNVNVVYIDAAGNLWVGTQGGVSKFDGTNWTNYTTANGLVDNNVTAIAVDKDNHPWFATASGVSKFDGTNWTTYTTADGLVSNTVNAIAVDSNNVKWFATSSGVSKFDGIAWTTLTTSDGLADNTVNDIDIDSDGSLWFATLGGASIFNGTTWSKIIYTGSALPSLPNAVALDNEGTPWFGTNKGVLKFDNTTWTRYTTADGLIGLSVFSVAVDAAGNKWFGTLAGVSKFDGASWTSYTTADGLVNNFVYTITIDASGNKWFGTQGGVSKFDGTKWTNYTTADSLINNNVKAIAIDSSRNVWFATAGGVSKFDGKKWRSFTTANGLPNNDVSSVVIDGKNVKWFGGKNVGGQNVFLCTYDDTTWKTIFFDSPLEAHPPSGSVFVAVDPSDNVWNNHGTTVYNNGPKESYYFASAADGSFIGFFAMDNSGNLWITNDRGMQNVVRCPQVPDAPVISSNNGILSSSATTGNQWYLNGTKILGKTSSTITPVYSGSYYAIVASNGCASKRSNEITAVGTSSNTSIPPDIIMGVNDSAIGTSHFSVWPNPTSGIVNVSPMDNLVENEFVVNIYSSTGALVQTQKSQVGSDFQVDLSNLKPGLYLIQKNNGKSIASSKIVKK